jgi:hypothetical protein
VHSRYNAVGDQALHITAVSLASGRANLPGIVIELANDESGHAFAPSNAAAAEAYGRGLLSDVKYYFGSQGCAVTVFARYDTADMEPCKRNPAWCQVRRFDRARQTWSVAWTYVSATSVADTDNVAVWHAQ